MVGGYGLQFSLMASDYICICVCVHNIYMHIIYIDLQLMNIIISSLYIQYIHISDIIHISTRGGELAQLVRARGM